MRNCKEGHRAEMDLLHERMGVEQHVEQEMIRLVLRKRHRGTGKELPSVDRAVVIWLSRFVGRDVDTRDGRHNQRGHQRDQTARATAERGTHVAHSRHLKRFASIVPRTGGSVCLKRSRSFWSCYGCSAWLAATRWATS